MTKVPCYLRTLRREWGMTQGEVAFLVGRGDRNRVSDVELANAKPNAGEILAYALIFGFPAREIFPAFYAEREEAIIRQAYLWDEKLKNDPSLVALKKRKLIGEMLARATGKETNPLDL